MADIKYLIKKDLEVEFVPKLQGLNKNFGVAATGGGDNPNKPKSSIQPQISQKVDGPAKPKTSMPKPTPTTKPTSTTTANSKPVAKPSMPKPVGIEKEEKDEKKSIEKSEEIYNEVMAGYKPMFLGEVKDLAKSNPILAISALPYNSLSKAGTQHIIAGEHVPNEVAPPPKSKKLKDKDKGSGGEITEKEEIPANKIIEPKKKEELEKQGMSMDSKGAAALKQTFAGNKKPAPAAPAAPKQPEAPKQDTSGGLGGMLGRSFTKIKNNFANGK